MALSYLILLAIVGLSVANPLLTPPRPTPRAVKLVIEPKSGKQSDEILEPAATFWNFGKTYPSTYSSVYSTPGVYGGSLGWKGDHVHSYPTYSSYSTAPVIASGGLSGYGTYGINREWNSGVPTYIASTGVPLSTVPAITGYSGVTTGISTGLGWRDDHGIREATVGKIVVGEPLGWKSSPQSNWRN